MKEPYHRWAVESVNNDVKKYIAFFQSFKYLSGNIVSPNKLNI